MGRHLFRRLFLLFFNLDGQQLDLGAELGVLGFEGVGGAEGSEPDAGHDSNLDLGHLYVFNPDSMASGSS